MKRLRTPSESTPEDAPAPKDSRTSQGEWRFFGSKGSSGFLSNYWPSPIVVDGVEWQTSEAYYQAQKFLGPASEAHREAIRQAHSPALAKELGNLKAGRWAGDATRKIIKDAKKAGVKLRDDWDSVKEQVMKKVLRVKFARGSPLSRMLLVTGDRNLVEASPFDSYWGIGKDGKGLNRLGVLLGEVREELKRPPTHIAQSPATMAIAFGLLRGAW